MLTKILLTHTTKLNIAFKLTLPIPIGLLVASHRCRLHGDATALASRTKDPPNYHARTMHPKLFLQQCLPSPDLSYNRNTTARPCLACRGAWYEASSGKTVVLFKFLKIIVKSQWQTSRFWCYTMLEIIAIAMSMSIIVITLQMTTGDFIFRSN